MSKVDDGQSRRQDRGRAPRAILAMAKATSLAVVFAVTAAGGVIVHLGLPAPHRFATARVNAILENSFKGKVVIQHVGALRLTRIDDIDAEVLDPEGKRVLYVHGARVRIGAVSLLRSLLGGGRLVVRLPEVTIDGLEAVLEEDAAGNLDLLRAFESRSPSTGGGRGTEISAPRIHLRHAWVHGHMAAAPILDADLDDLASAFTSTPETTDLEVSHLFVRGRGLPGMNPEGTLRAHATLPANAADPRQASAHYDGRVGDVPVRAEGSLDGKKVVAVVDVPETAPAALMALAPGRIQLGAPVRAHAEVRGELPVLHPDLHARIGEGELTASGTVTLPDETRKDLLASVTLNVNDLDVSLLREGAPRSTLTAAVDVVVVTHPGGKLDGTFHLENQIGEVSGQVAPAVSARGTFTEREIRGTAQIAERGAPTILQLSLQPRGGGTSPSQLAVQVDTTVPDLDGIERVGPIARGRARLLGEGSLDLDTKQVSGSASVEVAAIDVRGVQLARGVITGSVGETLDSPHLVVKLLGAGLRAGGYTFTSVRASASGSPEELAVETKLAGDTRAPTMTASAHLTRRGNTVVHGGLEAEVRNLSARGVEGGTVRVSAALEGTHLHGDVLASLGAVGKVAVEARDVTLGGPALRPASWKAATGDVSITGAVDLQRLLAQLPPESRPVRAAAGTIAIRGKASRASRSASPRIELGASTQGLAVVAKQATRTQADGTIVLGPAPWNTTGLDGLVTLKLDGSSGRAEIAAKLHDPHGALASIDASAPLPLAELSRSPQEAGTLLLDTPIEAKIEVPRRSLGAVPAALGKMPLDGEVELDGELHGTARAPKLTLTAKGTNLLPRGAPTCVRPMDLDARVAYDGDEAQLRLTASRDGSEVLSGDATVKVNAAQATTGGAIAWEGASGLTLTSFPIDAVGALVGQPFAGTVSGKLAVEGLHRAASLVADLDLRDLILDHSAIPRGKLHVGAKDGALSASVRLDQADGYAETIVTAAMSWGAAIAPRLDAAKAVEIALHAKNFRADAALPFTRGVFSELDGRLDTDATLHVEPGFKDGQMDGAVTIRDGVVEVPQIGERFDAVQGQITMRPWGTLRLEHLTAHAPTGTFSATAEAAMKGLRLQTATAKITIPKGESIPITLEGVPMGRAYGDVTAKARMRADGKRLDVDVDVPVLHVDLPQSTGHALQPLDPDKTVRVGVGAGRDFMAIPLGAPEEPRRASDLFLHAVVKLGSDVEVKRDTTIDVISHGQVVVDVGDKTHVTGQINLDRGKLELEGKLFTIEHGVVSFVGGDPGNPMVLASATWDAPDGTRVFADFSGYVSSGKLALHSEPSLTQDQILSLILFGSTDGTFGAEAPPAQEESTGVKAAGVVGGTITQGLNKAISGITSVDVTTRVDTSQADSPRPELAVQITKSVSARLGYKLGVPAPGENPDRTELTLDWRFIRNWSLVTTVGDAGSTAVDVVWRLRY